MRPPGRSHMAQRTNKARPVLRGPAGRAPTTARVAPRCRRPVVVPGAAQACGAHSQCSGCKGKLDVTLFEASWLASNLRCFQDCSLVQIITRSGATESSTLHIASSLPSAVSTATCCARATPLPAAFSRQGAAWPPARSRTVARCAGPLCGGRRWACLVNHASTQVPRSRTRCAGQARSRSGRS